MSGQFSRPLLAALAGLGLIAAPGCISLLPETEPDALYRLDAVTVAEAAASSGAETVVIGRISAPRGLAGDRIAIEQDGRIAYMAGAAWLSPAPAMLHAAVIDAFHAEAPAINPARTEDGISTRYALDLELRHFEAVYDEGQRAAPLVRVALRARMIDRSTRSLVASRSLEASRRAAANRQGAIVDAFTAASGEMARALADWTESHVCQTDAPPEGCPAR